MGEKSSKWPFIIVSLLISAILVTSAFIYYESKTKEIRHDKNLTLSTINHLKLEQISQWRIEIIGQTRFISTIGQVIRYTDRLIKDRNNKEARDYFYETLQPLKTNHNFENILICNKDGELLYSLDESFSTIDSVTSANIKSSVQGDSLVFGEIHYNSSRNKICIDITTPIKDNYGKVIGAFTEVIFPARFLFPMIHNWPMETHTGETLLAKKLNDRVVFLSELRFKDNTRLTQFIPLSDTEVVAVKGTMGERGVIEGVDYRGVHVLAELKPVPGTDWLLITKIDKDEIYSEIFFRAETIILIVVISILTIIFGALFFYKYKQSNIYKILLSKEQEFKATLYSIGDAVITTDAHGNIKQMNNVAEKLTGWKEKEAADKNISSVFVVLDEHTNKNVDNPVDKVLKAGTQIKLADYITLVSKNGKKIPIADSGSPITDKEGNIIGVVLVFRDQTIEREKEKQLLASNEKFKSIFNSAFDSISLTKLETGEIIEINDGFAKIFGFKKDEIIGKRTTEIGIWSDPSDREKFVDMLKSHGRVRNMEAIGKRKDGTLFPGVISAGIIKTTEESFVYTTVRDVTERKRFEETLKLSEENYRMLLDFASEAFLQTDENGSIIKVNRKAEELTGYSRQELVSLKAAELFPEENLQKVPFRYDLLKDGKSRRVERVIIRKDSKLVDVEMNTVQMPDGTYQTFANDITDRKNFVRDIQRFKFVSDYAPYAVFWMNEIAGFDYVNEKACESLGYTREELMKLNLFDIDPAYTKEKWDKRWIFNKENKVGTEILESFHKTKDGLVFPVEVVVQNYYIEDSILHVAFVRDISQRKRSEETLRKLSQAVEQSNVSIVITNKAGEIEYVNPKFCKVTGYKANEVFGRNPRILKSGSHSKEFYKELWDTVLSGKDWQGEIQNKKKNGELFWEQDLISPIFDGSGNITHFVAVKEDITEKKKMLEELVAAKEHAEEMNRAKLSFFANMSHELRTPFVGILGFAELLQETLTNPEEKDYAAKIVQSSKRLTDTLNKILNLSRLESTGYEVYLSSVNVNELVTEIGELFVQYAKTNNTIIKIETGFDDKKISTDRKLIEEILNNLLNNSVRFTKNGKITIKTEKVVKNKEDFLRLTVSDTGIGVPKEKQEIIWQEFRQASEGFSRSFEGTGLGLTITSKYVELLGGKIELESEENKGTTFRIEIPVVYAETITSNKENVNIPDSSTSDVQLNQEIKILFVENDRVASDYVKRVLKNQYKIDVVDNGDEALSIIKKNDYDIFLLDINLGRGIDGVELMKTIKKQKKYLNTPIVAVTAFAAESEKNEFLSIGFTHYLSKPFTSSELKELIASILANSI